MKTRDKLFIQQFEKRLSLFRWVLLILVWPLVYYLSDFRDNFGYFFASFVAICVYNLFVTIGAYTEDERYLPLLRSTVYVDVLMVTFVIATQGGLRSDIYFLYFVCIAYNGAKAGNRGTWLTLALSLICLTIITFFFTPLVYFDLNRYYIRFIFLTLSTLCINEMNHEIARALSREKEAMNLASKDPLTSLDNRLLLVENFEKMIDKHKTTGQPFAIVLFDIDNFKKINDSRGHSFGDLVLKNLANTLKRNITDDDFACRFGGEEFLVLFSNTDFEEAFQRANQIRLAISAYPFLGETVTVSGGINMYQKDSSIIENINFADQAMYAAKGSGKNQILSYHDLGAPSSLVHVMD